MSSKSDEFEGISLEKLILTARKMKQVPTIQIDGKPHYLFDTISRRWIVDYETMRLECLKLATAQGIKGDDAIAAADRMMKFARTGETDTIGQGRAKVVGRNGEMEKPFKDYLQRDE